MVRQDSRAAGRLTGPACIATPEGRHLHQQREQMAARAMSCRCVRQGRPNCGQRISGSPWPVDHLPASALHSRTRDDGVELRALLGPGPRGWRVLNMFTGGRAQPYGVFALAINALQSAASIIRAVMSAIWCRALEQAQERRVERSQEGVNQYTRYGTSC